MIGVGHQVAFASRAYASKTRAIEATLDRELMQILDTCTVVGVQSRVLWIVAIRLGLVHLDGVGCHELRGRCFVNGLPVVHIFLIAHFSACRVAHWDRLVVVCRRGWQVWWVDLRCCCWGVLLRQNCFNVRCLNWWWSVRLQLWHLNFLTLGLRSHLCWLLEFSLRADSISEGWIICLGIFGPWCSSLIKKLSFLRLDSRSFHIHTWTLDFELAVLCLKLLCPDTSLMNLCDLFLSRTYACALFRLWKVWLAFQILRFMFVWRSCDSNVTDLTCGTSCCLTKLRGLVLRNLSLLLFVHREFWHVGLTVLGAESDLWCLSDLRHRHSLWLLLALLKVVAALAILESLRTFNFYWIDTFTNITVLVRSANSRWACCFTHPDHL